MKACFVLRENVGPLSINAVLGKFELINYLHFSVFTYLLLSIVSIIYLCCFVVVVFFVCF